MGTDDSNGEDSLHQPHDKLFAATFGVPENAAALLRSTLPGDLSAVIDWDSLTLEPGSFVDSRFRQSHADLLFSAAVAGRETLLYVLFEHQSTRDPGSRCGCSPTCSVSGIGSTGFIPSRENCL